MEVLDEGRYGWFLFRKGEELFLDVNCNHSAVGYSTLIRLKDPEKAEYALRGRQYLEEFARKVQDRGPGSSLQRRHVGSQYDEESLAAVKEWLRSHPEP